MLSTLFNLLWQKGYPKDKRYLNWVAVHWAQYCRSVVLQHNIGIMLRTEEWSLFYYLQPP